MSVRPRIDVPDQSALEDAPEGTIYGEVTANTLGENVSSDRVHLPEDEALEAIEAGAFRPFDGDEIEEIQRQAQAEADEQRTARVRVTRSHDGYAPAMPEKGVEADEYGCDPATARARADEGLVEILEIATPGDEPDRAGRIEELKQYSNGELFSLATSVRDRSGDDFPGRSNDELRQFLADHWQDYLAVR